MQSEQDIKIVEIIEKQHRKPLVAKAYGSIPHLPNSRLGVGDHFITFGQADILTHKTRDKNDRIIVQEKLDGSCVCVANIDGKLVPLMRAGYEVETSKYEMLKMFGRWAEKNKQLFGALGLTPGDRIVGEWLAYAHGTIYDLTDRSPFVAFDIFHEKKRMIYDQFVEVTKHAGITTAPLINDGPSISVENALKILGDNGKYGATEMAEGLVYRCERRSQVDYLAKFVRQEKIDGKYFTQISGNPEIWLWHE